MFTGTTTEMYEFNSTHTDPYKFIKKKRIRQHEYEGLKKHKPKKSLRQNWKIKNLIEIVNVNDFCFSSFWQNCILYFVVYKYLKETETHHFNGSQKVA